MSRSSAARTVSTDASLGALAKHHARLATAWFEVASRFDSGDVPELAEACRARGQVEHTLARALKRGDLSLAVDVRDQGTTLAANGLHSRLMRRLEGFASADDVRGGAPARILLRDRERKAETPERPAKLQSVR